MIPSNIEPSWYRPYEPSWYRTYWYDEHPRGSDAPRLHALLDRVSAERTSRAWRRVDPALLALVLLFAALAIGAVLISVAAPVPPADLPYFVT